MNGYLTSSEEIARFLYKTIRGYGLYVRYNHSSKSESCYLNINLGTHEAPNAIHVRISNHPAPWYNKAVRFDYDICVSRFRPGALTYIKFLSQFARQRGKPVPSAIRAIQPGTPLYREYTSALRQGKAA
jgi:hypothetical protein